MGLPGVSENAAKDMRENQRLKSGEEGKFSTKIPLPWQIIGRRAGTVHLHQEEKTTHVN